MAKVRKATTKEQRRAHAAMRSNGYKKGTSVSYDKEYKKVLEGIVTRNVKAEQMAQRRAKAASPKKPKRKLGFGSSKSAKNLASTGSKRARRTFGSKTEIVPGIERRTGLFS